MPKIVYWNWEEGWIRMDDGTMQDMQSKWKFPIITDFKTNEEIESVISYDARNFMLIRCDLPLRPVGYNAVPAMINEHRRIRIEPRKD